MTCCRYPSERECPAWDAWVNPVADASDPGSLVSENAACGVWRPRMVLPFPRLSLVAYLRGWVRGYWFCVFVQSVCKIVGRILQLAEVRDEKDERACSAFRDTCRATLRLLLMGSLRGGIASWQWSPCACGMSMVRLGRGRQPEVRHHSGTNCRRVAFGGATG
ncbi:hypothetical protein TGARI_372830 [Toxoplasma gondii ARI]|uniref:Uncharacterized protein n=1 Tax=Toxoplasma gondii ARI TaxID=1074872 RepID=A0A139XI36_TOXGO|nr:hypothetical protein TGARI_372830 [Toxoplasma gondii ARI]